jgi:aerobic-type carbon monoxide dehydrogenase small subunit (CoxS/CutS family)
MIETINLKLNGKPTRLRVDGDRLLLWVLRSDLALTGTKCGCGEGFCGCCTVLINQRAVRSCQLSVHQVNEKEVITIEGLAQGEQLHPVQKAFMKHDALQCGFCTSGMILTASALLAANPQPSDDQIVRAMEDNLCRCGAHTRIIQAIRTAATEMKGGH